MRVSVCRSLIKKKKEKKNALKKNSENLLNRRRASEGAGKARGLTRGKRERKNPRKTYNFAFFMCCYISRKDLLSFTRLCI